MGHTILSDRRAETPGERLSWPPLLLLAVAVFATVTVELVPAGLVPAIAADFDVRVSAVGVLVSVWAITIAVASLPLVRLLRRVDRRTLLVGTLAVMALANAALAMAPSLEIAAASRLVAAAAHGVFWSIVMVYAAAISPPQHVGRAVAVTGTGATAAVLLGVPLGALAGQIADWRAVFWMLALVLLASGAIIRLTLPSVPATGDGDARVTRRDPTLIPVILIVVVQLFVALAQFTLYTYVAPFLTTQTDVPEGLISALLLLSGVGGLLGLIGVSFTADRAPRTTLVAALTLFVAALATLAVAPGSLPVVIVAFILWGVAIGALPPLLLGRTLRVSSDRLRSLASAAAVVAFNLGIAVGASSGGWIVDAVGLAPLPTISTAAAAVALVLCAWSYRFDPAGERTAEPEIARR